MPPPCGYSRSAPVLLNVRAALYVNSNRYAGIVFFCTHPCAVICSIMHMFQKYAPCMQVTHLGKTHFFMEAFAVATRRCFSADHALSYLLRAHTRFLIANNRLGRDKLVAVGGYTDRILSGTIAESVEMARVAVLATHLLEDNFKNDLVKRKVWLRLEPDLKRDACAMPFTPCSPFCDLVEWNQTVRSASTAQAVSLHTCPSDTAVHWQCECVCTSIQVHGACAGRA